MRRLGRIVLAAALAAAGLLAGPASPAGAGMGPPDPLTVTLPGTFRDLVVHPATGQVFVAAGDAVAVYSPTGALVATVEDQFQASGLALDGDDLYVTLAGSGVITRISTTTHQVTGAWTIGRAIHDTVAVTGGRVWFSHGTITGAPIGSLDPTTGDIALSVIAAQYRPLLRTSPARPGELYIGERGLSPANVQRWDVAVSPPVRLARTVHGAVGSNLRDFQLAPDGATLTMGAGAPYEYPAVDAATLEPTGLVYEGIHYPLAVAHSADGAVHVGGSDATYDLDVWVHAAGIPTSVTQVELGFKLAPRGLGLSPDGTALYAASTATSLRVQPLDMRIDSAVPSPVDLAEATSFRLDGARFQTARDATIDGIPAIVIPNVGGTRLTVLIPDGVAPGTHEVVVRSRIWSASTTVTFVATCDGRDATVVGTSGADHLVGTAGTDVIVGRGGNDVIDGRGGDDVICGGAGDDTVAGKAGNDVVHGGDGADTIDGGAGDDLLHGGGGADTIDGGVGFDGIDGGSGDDRILGSADTDVVLGGPGIDHVEGGVGDDLLLGQDGDDELIGGDGNDHLDGGAGHDVVRGSQGDDTLMGGAGNDTVRGQTGVDACDGGPDTDTHGSCEAKVGFP